MEYIKNFDTCLEYLKNDLGEENIRRISEFIENYERFLLYTATYRNTVMPLVRINKRKEPNNLNAEELELLDSIIDKIFISKDKCLQCVLELVDDDKFSNLTRYKKENKNTKINLDDVKGVYRNYLDSIIGRELDEFIRVCGNIKDKCFFYDDAIYNHNFLICLCDFAFIYYNKIKYVETEHLSADYYKNIYDTLHGLFHNGFKKPSIEKIRDCINNEKMRESLDYCKKTKPYYKNDPMNF